MQKLTVQGGLRRYPEISFLRGFSIFAVALLHLFQIYYRQGDLPQWLAMAVTVGGTGGHVFFFCSGFGLYLSWLRKPLKYGEFLKRRFLKIYIPYAIFIVLRWLFMRNVFGVNLWRELLSHLFLYKMFFERYEISLGIQLWFISTIFQFYFLFPLLCRLGEKLGMKRFFLLGLGVSMCWWILMVVTGLGEYRIWGSAFPQYLWEFALGMLAADRLGRGKDIGIPAWVLPVAALAGLSLQALMGLQGGWWRYFNDIPAFFGFTAGALLLYVYCRRVIRPFFLWMDGFSYEFFLMHVFVYGRGYGLLERSDVGEEGKALFAFVLALAVSWVYARLLKLLRLRQ